ncbi:hypothetical protein [Streptomyces viridochromogenes]|uniref:hypothetical protein n=1 Tax=Streptomyces viridochromogenes TaxID=1938 RepID=UPI000A74211B|nr:hypothetical protein [Streptomyces viridochromogenes]
MTEFEVTFTDGSTQTVEARSMRYTDHGVEFVGRKGSQGRDVVAFVPYLALQIVRPGKGASVASATPSRPSESGA